MSERAAYSPQEFSSLFGKSQTWGYRQIYAGRVETITQFGRIMIPASEVSRIVETAAVYSGQKPKPKKRLTLPIPEPESVWQKFLASRRSGTPLPSGKMMEKRTQIRGRLFRKS